MIEASTPLCLLQDAGRFGVRHLGVTQGGAAGLGSMSWANWLLGNGLDAPVIEMTLGGFTLVAEDDCCWRWPGRILARSWRASPGAVAQFQAGKGQTLAIHSAAAWGARLSGGARWFRCAEGVGQ